MIYNKMTLALMLLLNVFSAANATDLSLYQSSLKWKDENNKDFLLSSLRGKKTILAMAFTSCPGSCPLIVSKLKKIETLFILKKIPVEMVIISFDPAVDTPERSFSFYRETMNLTKANWHFLNGSENDTRKISMLLGIRFSVNPVSKAINHDNKIILLNENGDIENKLENLEEDESKLIK